MHPVLRVLRFIMEAPVIHQTPHKGRVGDAWRLLPPRVSGDKSSQGLAANGIAARTSQRGRNMAATLVFIGFLVAAQVSLIGFGYTGDDARIRMAVKPTIVGLMIIFWGMWPTVGNLIPKHRGDEGVEVLARTPFDWFYEDISRSSGQRQQLWRLRLAMMLSMLCTKVTLILLLFV